MLPLLRVAQLFVRGPLAPIHLWEPNNLLDDYNAQQKQRKKWWPVLEMLKVIS